MMMEKIKNYGLIIPEIITKEQGAGYILGSSGITGEIINPSGDWIPYLQEKESQNIRNIETQNCTAFGTTNCIEALLNFKGIKANYSDRYLGIMANTDPYGGNDPHKVCEEWRNNCGALYEGLLPFSNEIKSPEDYYKPKPMLKGFIEKGKEWFNEWDFSHEWLWPGNLSAIEKKRLLTMALQRGTVAVSVSAWYDNGGVYYKPQGSRDNHWTQLVKIDGDGRYIIFDSYADGEEDPYLKTLTSDYDFAIAKIFYVNPASVKFSIFQKILDLIGKILGIVSLQIKQLEPVLPIDQTPPPPVSPIVTPPAPPIVIVSPVYEPPEITPLLWDTPSNSKISVSIICNSMGFPADQKKNLMATLQGESGFDNSVKHQNLDETGKLLSTDWAICQINDYWNIGPGKPFPSVDYVKKNPEACVRWMIKMWQKGHAEWWIVYKSGAYKEYL